MPQKRRPVMAPTFAGSGVMASSTAHVQDAAVVVESNRGVTPTAGAEGRRWATTRSSRSPAGPGAPTHFESESEEDDWVVVEDDLFLPNGAGADPGECSQATKAAALAVAGGAAGMLLIGPLSGAALAAGVACTALGGSGDTNGTLDTSAVREWTEAGPTGEILRHLTDTTHAALASATGEALRASEVLGHGLQKACLGLSSGALAERDRAIAGLARELEQVERDSIRERGEFAQSLEAAESTAQEARERLALELEASERAKAEEVARLEEELDSARRGKENDCARLERELELARHAGEQESSRLRKELKRAEQAREKILEQRAKDLEAARRAHEHDAEQLEHELALGRQLATEVETMKKVREESICCICLEAPRQVLFLPCKHVCCCDKCAAQVDSCPVDRLSIDDRIRFTMA